jgi:hypothetical protein
MNRVAVGEASECGADGLRIDLEAPDGKGVAALHDSGEQG